MKKIKLNKGTFATVDNDDFEYLNQWKWYINNNGYAIRTKYTKLGFKKYKMKKVYMHRVVNNTPDNLQTDHINHNQLDNRRINLRSVTNQQNAFNASLNKANTSGTKGVSWSKERKNGVRIFILMAEQSLSVDFLTLKTLYWLRNKLN